MHGSAIRLPAIGHHAAGWASPARDQAAVD
jgi:hypothetical protein